MRWHRRLTTTQQMKNQSSDMAGYLLFTVPVYHPLFFLSGSQPDSSYLLYRGSPEE